MAKDSKIEWCDHTASPWYGCAKVHEGCEHCYAESMSHRNPGTLGVWGDEGVRVKSKSFIKNLQKWNALGERLQKRQLVFPSLCDPFEDRPELVPWRREMFDAIDRLPWVTLLLLTKRPENIRSEWMGETRNNVWLGTSISLQEHADKQIPELIKCRDLAPVLFLSVEPMLGPIDLRKVPRPDDAYFRWSGRTGVISDPDEPDDYVFWESKKIDWVIVGGESGPHARPMHPDWVRSLRDQCHVAGVPYFFKQWGEWWPLDIPEFRGDTPLKIKSWEWPPRYMDQRLISERGEMSRLDETWTVNRRDGNKWPMAKVGKKDAGRLLDGVEHSESPKQGGPIM